MNSLPQLDDRRTWRLSLAALAIATAILNLVDLHNGQRSEYYAAIATSMSKSFSNFLFGALDPAGTVTLDKIPGSYWIPAIFIKIFGFSTWAVDAPNAIAGIFAVIIIAITVKNLFGKSAGILAGALVATTPILAAVVRSNQPQTFFLLTLALTTWAASKALTLNSRKWLIAAGGFIALGFHMYMLEAWALWPALIVAYFLTAQPRAKKIRDILTAGSISFALSMTWITIATLTPRSARPYIGGTDHNNPFEMVFGYNGLGRFSLTTKTLSGSTDDPTFRSFTPPFGGKAGFDRLFNNQVAGQIAWLIPAAIIAAIALLIWSRKNQFLIFIIGWFITFALMFSLVAGIHQFYVSALAFPIAILVTTALIQARQRGDWLVPTLIIGGSALWTLLLSDRYSTYFSWSSKVQFLLALIALIVFASNLRRLTFLLPLALFAGLAFTPAIWAYEVKNQPSAINPIAGPETGMGGGPGGFGGPGGMRGGAMGRPNFDPRNFANGMRPNFGGQLPSGQRPQFGGGFPGFDPQSNVELVKYLKQNRGNAKFLLATFGGMSAAPFITATGENILPIGGFDGQDPAPKLKDFIAMVKKGEVKYVLMGGGGGRQQNADNQISRWVTTFCTIDPAAPGASSLYLCR